MLFKGENSVKKKLAAVLSAVLCMGLFTGCGKDFLEKDEWYLQTKDGEWIGKWYQFEDGKFSDVPLSLEGNYQITDDDTIVLEYTDCPERFRPFSGEYSYTVDDEELKGIYVETISELAQFDQIALFVEADIISAMDADGKDLSSDSYALICSDKSKNTGTESLVWNDSGENAADELYTHIEEAISEYGDYEYILCIIGGGLMDMLIADDYDNILTGIHPHTGCSYYIDTEDGYEKVELEGELTLDTAYEFYKNYIQNGES